MNSTAQAGASLEQRHPAPARRRLCRQRCLAQGLDLFAYVDRSGFASVRLTPHTPPPSRSPCTRTSHSTDLASCALRSAVHGMAQLKKNLLYCAVVRQPKMGETSAGCLRHNATSLAGCFSFPPPCPRRCTERLAARHQATQPMTASSRATARVTGPVVRSSTLASSRRTPPPASGCLDGVGTARRRPRSGSLVPA